MKRSDAVHTPFICSQGGAKCRKPSVVLPVTLLPRHVSRSGSATTFFVSTPSSRPYLVPCAQGDRHGRTWSPGNVRRHHTSPPPPTSTPGRAPRLPDATVRSADGRRDTSAIISRREALLKSGPCPPSRTLGHVHQAIATTARPRPSLGHDRRRRPGAQAHGCVIDR